MHKLAVCVHMSVCMYMYIYIYIYIYIYVNVYLFIMQKCIYACMCMSLLVYIGRDGLDLEMQIIKDPAAAAIRLDRLSCEVERYTRKAVAHFLKPRFSTMSPRDRSTRRR